MAGNNKEITALQSLRKMVQKTALAYMTSFFA